MKNLIKLFALAVVILGFSATSFGQVPATASTSASIVTALTIEKTTDMNFGPVVAGTNGGTVLLDYADGRTFTGTGVSIVAGSGASSPKTAVFTINGLGASAYSITIPTGAINLTGPTSGLTVGSFTSEDGLTGNLTGGSKVIKIKATLNLPVGVIATGSYTNSSDLSVTVAYN